MIGRWIGMIVIAAGLALAGISRGATSQGRGGLSIILPELRFEQTPMGEVYDFLRDVAGINLHVNWRALEEAGVSRDMPVNIHLNGVSVRKVLDLILAESGSADRLTWYVDDGVVEVTTREVADRRTMMRVYPIDDLIMEILDFVGPALDLSSATQGGSRSGGGGGSASGGSLLKDTGNEDRDQPLTKAQRVQALIDLITQTIQPDIWRVNGGTATITYLNGSLIVNAPRSVQEAIGGPVD
ncbi:MAG: hypothetical protein IT447_04755 [Phycisphaerales bacterium]|jgi:hypothetical protein|nr:hypothetical protein [Phycisphaerales bacterium]